MNAGTPERARTSYAADHVLMKVQLNEMLLKIKVLDSRTQINYRECIGH